MSCPDLTSAFKRISARKGQVVDLNVDFLRNGQPTDPYAIRYVEIYKSQILPHNLVATIPIVDPTDINYPSPLCMDMQDAYSGQCGTEYDGSQPIAGKYHLPFTVPNDFSAPDVYFDVWYYYAEDPCDGQTCDLDSDETANSLSKCCNRFWLYPDGWFCNDGLQTVRFGFEPLDNKFYYPECRPLEVGLMPLPLYDYNFNLVNPMIPFIKPTIIIDTMHNEVIVDGDDCTIGIRQGSYRTNPWVIKYQLDTSKFLKGTYRYQIILQLPDGSTRVSRRFNFTIA